MQVKYVVELARGIAQHPAVYRVHLLTRLIQDPNVDPSYGEPEECIWKAPDEKGLGGAYIERLACGPPKKYLRCWTLSGASDALMHAAMLGKRKAWCPDPPPQAGWKCDGCRHSANPCVTIHPTPTAIQHMQEGEALAPHSGICRSRHCLHEEESHCLG